MATKSAGNITLTFDSTDITAYMNQQELGAVVNEIDTTDFSSTGTEMIAGLPTWTLSAGGVLDDAIDNLFGPQMVTPPTTLKTAAVVVGSTTYTWTTNAFASNYRLTSSAPSDALTWTCDITLSGVPARS